jgi:hypothetical protein
MCSSLYTGRDLKIGFFAAQMFFGAGRGALSVVLPQIWQNLALSAMSVPP